MRQLAWLYFSAVRVWRHQSRESNWGLRYANKSTNHTVTVFDLFRAAVKGCRIICAMSSNEKFRTCRLASCPGHETSCLRTRDCRVFKLLKRRNSIYGRLGSCLDFCVSITPDVCSNAVLWLSVCRFFHLQTVWDEVSVTLIWQLAGTVVRSRLNGCTKLQNHFRLKLILRGLLKGFGDEFNVVSCRFSITHTSNGAKIEWCQKYAYLYTFSKWCSVGHTW